MIRSLATMAHGLALSAALAFSLPAAADLDVSRDVTITDDGGGTLTLTTSATYAPVGSESLTTARFQAFRPRDDGRTVDGEVTRDRVRDADVITTVFEGALEIHVPAGDGQAEQLNTLVFEGLTVQRLKDERALSGTVIYNGREIDAGALPPRIRALLVRTLRFFHFA